MKRMLSLFCALSLLLTLAQPALAASTRFGDPPHGQKDFTEMKYQRPDLKAFTGKCEAAIALIDQAGGAEAAAALIEELVEDMEQITGMDQLISVYQSLDVTNRYYANEVAACDQIYSAAMEALCTVMDAVRASNAAHAALKARLSPETYQGVMQLGSMPKELLSIREKQTELCNTYLERANRTYTTKVNGTVMTQAELNKAFESGELAWKVYSDAYDEIDRQRNEALGGIYIQLLPLYRQEAALCGYDDPVEYLYRAYYDRDYSSKDMDSLAEIASEVLAPVLQKLSGTANNAALETLRCSMTGTEIMDLAAPYLSDLGPEFQESYQYMRTHHLVDLDASPTKAETGFTISLYADDSIYMFDSPYGSFYDITTFIHEFGHYNQTYWTTPIYGWLESFRTDVLEIHSQGLELLYHAYYEQMFGELAQDARAYSLVNLLDSVLSGCMVDEFERYALTTENVTLQQLNTKYQELQEQYGVGGNGLDWVGIHHIYETPCYYIAYATSAVTALQIWTESLADRAAAVETYYQTLEHADETYFALLKSCGLDQPADAALLQTIRTDVEKQAGVSVDTYGHWAEEAIDDMRYFNMMKGTLCADGYTRFFPAQAMTRSQLAVTLYRLNQTFFEPGKESTGPAAFSDVTPDAWYADAAAWAAENGIMGGYADGSFRGGQAISRQELAAVLYRFWDYAAEEDAAPEDASSILADFQDGAEVADAFAEALAWAVDTGLLSGKDGNLLPRESATRAQCAVVLERMLWE